jgi:hypothetical protein
VDEPTDTIVMHFEGQTVLEASIIQGIGATSGEEYNLK